MISEIIDDATLDWLLEKSNPSVRYFTQTKLLGLDVAHPEVVETKKEIMTIGLVPKILDKQLDAGNWGTENNFYLEKYKGTVWQLIVLAELGADPNDKRIRKACEFILSHSWDPIGYGFSVSYGSKERGGRHSEVIPCLTGNMIFSLIKLGFLTDDRVQKGIDWICTFQRCDDGASGVPKTEPYERFEGCWGAHTCHMGVAKALKALTAIPLDSRTEVVNRKIQELMEFMLIHHIFKKSHHLEQVSKPGWLKFGFPLMYQSDALEVLEILTDLDCRDDRLQETLDQVRSKQQSDRRWKLENTYNGRLLYNVEEKGENSKWVTLRAVNCLQKFNKQ
jgi:hypothetical protein